MNGDQLALVMAASIPAAITTVGGIWLARVTNGMRRKVHETHHSVTVNHHSSENPTVLDRIAEVGDIATEGRDLAQAALDAALTSDLRTAAMQAKLDEHLKWSDNETRNLWRAVWFSFRGAKERHELVADEQAPEQRGKPHEHKSERLGGPGGQPDA